MLFSITKRDIFVFCCVALMSIVYSCTVTREPAVQFIKNPVQRSAILTGTDLAVHVVRYRVKSSCFGSYAVRKVAKFWDVGTWKEQKEVYILNETSVADENIGSHEEIFHFTMPQKITGDDWYFTLIIHESCGLFSWLIPEQAITLEPTKITITP